MQLYDLRGQRKYLTQHERDRLLKAARAAGIVIFESLKKRRRGVLRAVPVPTGLLETLARPRLRNERAGLGDKLWSCSRTTAWRRVRAMMRAAEVRRAAATPKGLRQAFGTVAVAAVVPLTIIQK